MNPNGNNLGVTVTDVIEKDSHGDQGESAFYDPSNPVFAPAKETVSVKKKNWKRKLIGWGFIVVLLVGCGVGLYSLLKINRVDVKVLADNRRDGLSAKSEPNPNKTENGLSAEAINIARAAMGADANPNSAQSSAAPTASPSTEVGYRLDYSATVNPGPGPANDIGPALVESSPQSNNPILRESPTGNSTPSVMTLPSRANATQSIFVDDSPSKLLASSTKLEAVRPSPSNAALVEKKSVQSTALPPFGTMLPVRTQAVIFTVRNNSYARLELTRDLKGEGWSLPKGTVLIGRTSGSELDRAFLNVIGYVDPRENRFVKMTGEVLGSDGGAGLQGKRVTIDRNRFKQTLAKVASSGLQVAGMMAGALTGRGTLVVNGAGYRLLNPVTDEAGRLVNGGSDKRAFVKVGAGQHAYVMVSDLPKDIHAVDAPGEDEVARAATSLTDREVMELILLGTPDEIRAAMPLMTDEQKRLTLKTVSPENEKR